MAVENSVMVSTSWKISEITLYLRYFSAFPPIKDTVAPYIKRCEKSVNPDIIPMKGWLSAVGCGFVPVRSYQRPS